jgi:hypothetical protein
MLKLNFGPTDPTMTPYPRQLEALSSDAFVQRFSQIGTVEGIFAALRRTNEVRSLHAAIREEIVNEADIDKFIRSLLTSFVSGKPFVFQLSLAGIASACAGINKAFARDFVSYLAKLRSSEMLLATQIADQALQLIPTTIRETITTTRPPDCEVRFLESVPRSSAGQTTIVFEEELVDA